MSSLSLDVPAAPSQLPLLEPKTPAQKRKRMTDTSTDEGDQDTAPKKKLVRKKALRACLACQRAHLTCDDARPCTRCQQRSTECMEGHRKKPKYIYSDEELEHMKRSSTSVCVENLVPDPPPAPDTLNRPESALFDPNFPFGSEAANLEYSILSAILGNSSPSESSNSPPTQTYQGWTATEPMPFVSSSYSSTFAEPVPPPEPTTTPSTSSFMNYSYQEPQPASSFSDVQQYRPQYQQNTPLHPLQPRFPLDARPRSPPTSAFLESARGAPPVPSALGSKLQNINDRVTKPYDYTEGYHFLMKHLPSRFEKNDILRIVRALAIFRPSLIALQMPLSLDDEVFVEKCFQRSLLELEKLISFSGTPTVVWRRTGEICLVAPEFCLLSEWRMEDLVGRKKYIYELFENQSVVEYWENFASHAFENTTQSVYSHCVLLKPSGAPVPSTFCFSIRRDLFDLPSLVIGQWLPLL